MDLAEKFLLESHVSLHKFCSSVEIEYQDMLPKLVSTGNNYTVYVMYDIVQDDANHVHVYTINLLIYKVSKTIIFTLAFSLTLRLKRFVQY